MLLPTLVFLLLTTGLPAFADQGSADILRATLDNGLRVVIVRNTLAPVVTTEVTYLVGADETPPGFPGTAHAVEHMMFRGSKGLTAGQLADISAAMGGQFNAQTRQTTTQYFFTVPAEDLDVALHVEALRMRSILSTEKLWQRERGAIEQEVARDLSSPQYVFYTHLLKTMFAGTVYAHDALGTRASFNKTTGKMLRQFHQTWYAPNNAVLVIVGDVEPRQALQRIERLFGPIPAKHLPARPKISLRPVRPQTLEMSTDRPYGLVSLSYRFPGLRDRDHAAVAVLADVLNSQRGRLYALVPEGKALYAGFQLTSLPRAAIGSVVALFPEGSNPKKLRLALENVLKDVAKHGVSADLVAAAKRRVLTEAALQKNSVSGLADAWSEALAIRHLHSPREAVEAIRHVTVADVNRVARRYLDPKHMVTAILTPRPSGKAVASSGFGGAESLAPKSPHRVALPKWAATALRRAKVPKPTINPVVQKLPNGLTLIVQPEAISDTVSLYGSVRSNADVQTPRGKEGVARLLDNLFDYGSKSLNRIAFQKALDDIGADEDAGTDFYVQTLAPHFAEGVKLLAENELSPALPSRAFSVVKHQLEQSLPGELQSPGFLLRHALHQHLYPKDDPSLRHASPDSVKGLTLDDVRAYYRDVMRPDMTTIVVIGNITPKRAKTIVTRYFGKWRTQGPKPKVDLPAVPPNSAASVHVPDASRVQDRVILSETLHLTRHDPDYYALRLGNKVLGGAFYATRLYRDLRENTGLVYSVDSWFDVGRTRSVYAVEFACDPANVSKARNIVVRDLRTMQKEPITARELSYAQALLLREIPLSESNVDSIAGNLLYLASHDLPLDEPIRAAHRYLALTPADVKAAYAKWLRPDDLVQAVLGPTPK